MKKRILHVLASNKFSGAENVACTIIENDKEYEMFYCSPEGSIKEEVEKRNIKYIPLKKFTPFEINKICNKYNIDIIHAHDMKASFITSLANKKIKKVSTLHVDYAFNSKWTIYSIIFRLIIKKFYKIICVSQEVYDKAIFINDITKNKFIVIPNVIDKEKVIKKSTQYKTKKYDMVYLGRITEVKRPEWVIDITKEVVKKHSDFKVAMIGTGNLDNKIKDLIKDNNLEKNIDFVGFTSNPFPYVKNSKFSILTSLHEGLPMSVIECMVLNVPVLNTGVDGLGTFFKGNEDFICKTKKEFISKIEKILEKKLDLSKRCSEIVKQSTNIKDYIDKINDIYDPKTKVVLQVLYSMNTGGMESLIMNNYRNIDKEKFQYNFLINDFNKCLYEDEIISLGGKIFRAHSQHPHVFKSRREVRNIINYNNFDVIHSHQGITYYYPLKVAKKAGIKKIVIHNHGINRYFLKYLALYNNLWAKNRICHFANEYISITDDVKDQIFSNEVIKNKKYVIINNAIDPYMFKYSNKKREVKRKELSLKNETVFIHVGNFNAFKNYGFLIDTFNEYLKEDSNAKFLIIGCGPLEKEVKERVHNLKIDKKVMFLGKRSDISDLLSAADMMIFPSFYEGYPMALIEAQASGINIIASDKIDSKCKICDNYMFLPIDNPKDWVPYMKNMNKKLDREKYADVVNNSDYSITKTIKKLENIYER